MLYALEMKEIATKEACDILRIHKFTLYRWADQGKIKMRRIPPLNYRVFDYDEIKRLADRMPKARAKHIALNVDQYLKRKKKAK